MTTSSLLSVSAPLREKIDHRHFVWGPDIAGQQTSSLESEAEGVGGLLLIREWKPGIGMKQYLPLTDGLGSVCGLIDGTDGSLVAEYDYDPYGGPVIERGIAADACPFRHRTRYYDTETGLYYFRNRIYLPERGEFASPDMNLGRGILGELDGMATLTFCGGDPVNLTDPTGLSVWSEREDDVDSLYQEGRPVAAFFYDFGVRAWNGFSFGMLERQSNMEDALLNGDISMGQYARGATVNVSISGAQLALTVGGAGQVGTAAKGSATFIGAIAQGTKIGAGYGFANASLETLGGRMADAVAGVEHGTTWGEDAVTISQGTINGAILGGALSGTAYGAVKAYQSLQKSVGGLMDVRYGPKNLEPLDTSLVNSPSSSAGVGGALKVGVNSAENVIVYRVEGTPNTRILIGEGGVVVVEGENPLFLNFGSKARAEQYLAQKVSATQKMGPLPGAKIKLFEVPASFLAELKLSAVTEAELFANPALKGRPLVVDLKAPNQFGLRAEQIKALRKVIIQGSGKDSL